MSEPRTTITGEAAIRERLKEAVLGECKRQLATDYQTSVQDILEFWGGKLGLSAREMETLVLSTKN